MKEYNLGKRICDLRTKHGYSQFQLGKLVGVSDKAVSKWENNDARPKIETCRQLAKIFGIDINSLLSFEQEINAPKESEQARMNRSLWIEAYERLYSIYGQTPPAHCISRLASEQAALHNTNAAQVFAILGKIQEEAKKQNTLIIVGGVDNSSFGAWLFGGTNVNPLPPHYICPQCGYVEFVSDISDGFDLPSNRCVCGCELLREGHNIPYEGYAKAEQSGSIISIQVSETFKPDAIKVLKAFYQGIAEVLPVIVNTDDPHWYFEKYVVLPREKKRPAVSDDGIWYTDGEHYWDWFDNEIEFTFYVNEQLNFLDRIQKVTRTQLPDIQGLLSQSMSEELFKRRCDTLPFITDVLPAFESHSFELIRRIDGLSHSISAWEDNAELLIQSGEASIFDVPAAREDVWSKIAAALAKQGVHDRGLALLVMEYVRKGRFDPNTHKQIKSVLSNIAIPTWYMDCLSKIQYLFPKGHCFAFLIVDIIQEWFRMTFPAEYSECRKGELENRN